MHKQYKGLGLTADVKVLRILQLAEAHLVDKPGMYQRLCAEIQNASHGVMTMVCAIQSPEWVYHALRGEQHMLDFRLGKLIDEWASNHDSTELDGHQEIDQPEVNIVMTATSDELCAAFGPVTGMNNKWFRHWNDIAGLKAALAERGRRGKQSVKPRFYVFPVVQWLITGKRKIGKPIQESTAWRILEHKFSKVYEEYETHDPRDAG